jgi:hypothetical protein
MTGCISNTAACDYDDLPRGVFSAYHEVLSAFQRGWKIIICMALLFIETDPRQRFAIFFAVLNILVVNGSRDFSIR